MADRHGRLRAVPRTEAAGFLRAIAAACARPDLAALPPAGVSRQIVSAAPPVHVTLIGPNDPAAQRSIMQLIDKAQRRNL